MPMRFMNLQFRASPGNKNEVGARKKTDMTTLGAGFDDETVSDEGFEKFPGVAGKDVL